MVASLVEGDSAYRRVLHNVARLVGTGGAVGVVLGRADHAHQPRHADIDAVGPADGSASEAPPSPPAARSADRRRLRRALPCGRCDVDEIACVLRLSAVTYRSRGRSPASSSSELSLLPGGPRRADDSPNRRKVASFTSVAPPAGSPDPAESPRLSQRTRNRTRKTRTARFEMRSGRSIRRAG